MNREDRTKAAGTGGGAGGGDGGGGGGGSRSGALGEAEGIGSSTEKDCRLQPQDWTDDLKMVWERRRAANLSLLFIGKERTNMSAS